MAFLIKYRRALAHSAFWQTCQAFWRWWLAQLLELLPASVRELLSATRENLILAPEDEEIKVFQRTGANTEEVFRIPLTGEVEAGVRDHQVLSAGTGTCELRLTGKDILESSVTLPLAAEENLRQVLAYEMDRLTPFSEDQVYFDYLVEERHPENQTLSLRLYVTLRTTIDRWLERLTEVGLLPDRIRIDAGQAEPISLAHLLPGNLPGNRRLVRFRINLALGLLLIILLASSVVLPVVQKRMRIEAMELALEEAVVRAKSVQSLRDRIDQLQKESQFLNEQYLKRPSIVQIIRELTDVLPDDTWLNRLDISGAELQVQGQSETAALLIQLIESSPLFTNVRFRSAVVKVPRSNTEQFHLSADLAATGNNQ
jgi:general secretion pathway protein L